VVLVLNKDMTDFNFKITDKNGKVVENLNFDDFDAVADYMLEAADKWYSGLQDPETIMSLERKENGNVVFKDESSFGGTDIGPGDEGDFDSDIEAIRQAFGASELPRAEDIEDS